MNKYRIRIAATVYYNAEIEAENEDIAENKVRQNGFEYDGEKIEWDLTTLNILSIDKE